MKRVAEERKERKRRKCCYWVKGLNVDMGHYPLNEPRQIIESQLVA